MGLAVLIMGRPFALRLTEISFKNRKSPYEPPHEGSLDAPEEPKQEWAKDDIADMVGLLESTSFTSKHILQGSDESVANGSHTPYLEKERQRIGEIPDEE